MWGLMDGQMDMKLKSAFHNSANTSKNGTLNIFIWLVLAAPLHWDDNIHCLVSLLHAQIDGVTYDIRKVLILNIQKLYDNIPSFTNLSHKWIANKEKRKVTGNHQIHHVKEHENQYFFILKNVLCIFIICKITNKSTITINL